MTLLRRRKGGVHGGFCVIFIDVYCHSLFYLMISAFASVFYPRNGNRVLDGGGIYATYYVLNAVRYGTDAFIMTTPQSLDISAIHALLKKDADALGSDPHVAAPFFEKMKMVFDANMEAFVVVLSLNQKSCRLTIDRHAVVMTYLDEPFRHPFVFSFDQLHAPDLDEEKTKKASFFMKLLMALNLKIQTDDCQVFVQKRETEEVTHECDQ